MTTDQALHFLRSNQPLPPTREISQELLEQFDEVRKHFASHPDNQSVPLLLNSFGEGDAHGVYQLVEEAILAHPENIVIPALLDGLQSSHSSVREWCSEIAANYPRPELIAPLVDILKRGSVDERLAAVTALQFAGFSEARNALESLLHEDIDNEVRKGILAALGR